MLARDFLDDHSFPLRGALRGFELILALVVATEYVAKALRDRALLGPLDLLQVALAVAIAMMVVQGRFRRLAFYGLAALQLWWIVTYFPLTGNHRYLELCWALLLATLDREHDDESRLLLGALRWTTVVVLFASGLQKLAHGYWFRGQFLAWSLWRDEFRTVLGPLFSAEELARLSDYGASAGDGPYLVSSLAVNVLSNGVWIAQLTLAALLVPRATRGFAWGAAVVMVVATEVVARELMFGIEFCAALLLFARSDLLRKLVLPVVALLALLLAMRLGLLPEVLFH